MVGAGGGGGEASSANRTVPGAAVDISHPHLCKRRATQVFQLELALCREMDFRNFW